MVIMLDTIGNIASIAGFFLGIVYGIGLVIVTIHLNRYGITSVYLVQARYLVVGFVYLIHVLGMAIFSAPLALVIILIMGLENSTYIIVPIGLLGLILVLQASYAPITFENKMKRKHKSKFDQKNYWRFWHVTMFCSILMLWQTSARAVFLGDLYSKIASISLLIAVLFTGVVYYTIFLYQSPISVGNPILELIGAGQPIKIRLTVDKDKISSFQKYGLFTTQDEISDPLLLLDETSQDFLVIINFEGKERAVKINKSVVNSVIYLP
jgi:hypothetical protein